MNELQTKIFERARYRVAEGFDSREEIIESLTDWLVEDYEDEIVVSEVTQITDELLAKHFALQAEWSAATDCDRLDKAFARLNDMGIVARQHWTCCHNCGLAEIWDEINGPLLDEDVQGYAFYTQHDTETAYFHKHLSIMYASLGDDLENFAAVGHIVVNILREAGLTVEWNGDPKKLIEVVNLDWKRRRN